MEHHHHHEAKRKIILGKKLKITSLLFFAVFILSYIPVFEAFNKSLLEYLSIIWWAVILGFLLGGVIDYFVPNQVIFKYLGQGGKKSIFYAVLGGFIFSTCSHGILAISMQLYKKGASIPSVLAFLLASPWASLPITILLFGFFGWKAFLFILAALVMALVTGFIFILLDRLNLIEKSKTINVEENYSWDKIQNFNLNESIVGVTRSAINLSNMVLWWILIGVVTASLIGVYIPEHFFHQYLGASILGLFATLIFATIIEICSEGSAPIAFEIFNKLGTFGNPFVFLMAGVVTDYTEIGLIWTNIGKKTAIWLPIIAVPQILIVGFLFNQFLS